MSRARSLRKNSTRYEKTLWRHLRNRNFANYKFRRQHPVGCYIIDFYCPEAHLAIELDGGGHNYIAREIHDQARTQFLANQGIRVLRFWNHQVRDELGSVLESIWFELEERGRSNTSP